MRIARSGISQKAYSLSVWRDTLWLWQKQQIGFVSLLALQLLCAQGSTQLFGGSELILLRFHRGYLPPLLGTGVMGGATWEIFRSGSSHRLLAWGEARLTYLLGASLPPVFPGGTLGLCWRIGLPDPEKLYAQVGAGIDGYILRTHDKGGTPFQDQQLRPLLQIEAGTFVFLEPVFIRYSFYPTPGTTSKYVISIGTYFGG
ncbi:MAG: hypothetical protein N2170_02765 [Bacteroidia bacterium]|nr:hypothetical protein [Bacteroidia bacterium]